MGEKQQDNFETVSLTEVHVLKNIDTVFNVKSPYNATPANEPLDIHHLLI